MKLTYEAIAGRIDHALLTPAMTDAEMRSGCELARRYEVASVCIKPAAVPLAVTTLEGSNVLVGTVVGFPHGGQTTRVKLAETTEAIDAGACEIDMVVNIGDVVGGEWTRVENELGQIARHVHERKQVLKIIFETYYLTEDQKIKLCELCGTARIDYVKTSTGFGGGGATIPDIILMRQHSPRTVKVKASGGIRDLEAAIKFAELGSDRLGLSRTSEILEELNQRLGLPSRDVSRGTKNQKQPTSDY